MDISALRSSWSKLRRYRPLILASLFIISAVICVFALRHNNLHMVDLRNQVYAADKRGQGVEPALDHLRNYVTIHMNTDLSSGTGINPPIQLKYTYERAQQSMVKPTGNDQFYTEAQDVCQQEYPVESSLYVWQHYVSCVENYLNSHHVDIKVSAPTVPPAIYEFDFASPTWSPDLAGWSLVATALFLVLAIISFFVDFWLKRDRRVVGRS
ncbi:MAG: hypothetical protein ACREHG_01565 [Candidatus Saccharimonadales bacterium]